MLKRDYIIAIIRKMYKHLQGSSLLEIQKWFDALHLDVYDREFAKIRDTTLKELPWSVINFDTIFYYIDPALSIKHERGKEFISAMVEDSIRSALYASDDHFLQGYAVNRFFNRYHLNQNRWNLIYRVS